LPTTLKTDRQKKKKYFLKWFDSKNNFVVLPTTLKTDRQKKEKIFSEMV